jgi:Zn-dependent peptidase ImmA (M78 family)
VPDATYKTATEVIADFTHDAPVDVYALARALGLDIKETKLDEDVSGKIERNWFPDTYTISINSRHPPTRRRFTAAHEIAHFVLHRDLIGDGIVDDALYRSKKGDAIERQANAYAATILMPAPLVIEKFRGGEKSIAGIASAFEVSPEVARIRMLELRLN